MDPAISVVVPTYNGGAHIVSTLSSLAKQTYSRFEVVVVVDGSQDGTAQTIAKADLPLSMVVHEQENKGRAGARNAGLSLSKADYVVFLDDDVQASDTLIECYAKLIREGHVVVVGSIYPLYKIENEYSRYSSYLNLKWNADLPSGGGFLDRPYLSAANFMIKKSLMVEMGGFDSALNDAEDFDLAIRLKEAGTSIYFDPAPKVGHLIHANFHVHMKRLLQYKAFYRVLLARNSAAAKYVDLNHVRNGFFRKWVYTLLSGRTLVSLIDSGVFRIIPAPLRFKLYDVVLTAYVMHNSLSAEHTKEKLN